MNSDINQNNILAHIVGLNDYNKSDFIQKMKLSKILNNIYIIDVDIITKNIVEETNMAILFKKFEHFKNNKLFTIKAKEIEKKIFQYWKVKMEYYINKLIKNKMKVILIGYLSFFNNHRIYINLDIVPKFFLNVNYIDHTKMIIKYNIENYKDDIIDSKFDLNYLDSNFLIKKRMNIQSIYNKISYFLMSLNSIINCIELFYSIKIPDKLYFSSFNKYEKKIPILSLYNICYTLEWLSLGSILNNNNENIIKKEIKNNIKHIYLTKEQYNKMSSRCYLYEIENINNFIPYPNKNNIYKYISLKPLKIGKSIYIDNIINKLNDNNIVINIV